ncbi:hypothetical protein G4B88_011129 [Cannabis sativa]|uniref:Uncharacterized protein n=1 Tax=Cannabis sativa TaxID=3483 RepID=A0A7J6HIZ4_CANSA|nr:hypothetical protein G4B88_011129 [Cannabis sativa]
MGLYELRRSPNSGRVYGEPPWVLRPPNVRVIEECGSWLVANLTQRTLGRHCRLGAKKLGSDAYIGNHNEKLKQYEADYIRRLMAKYFTKKDLYGVKLRVFSLTIFMLQSYSYLIPSILLCVPVIFSFIYPVNPFLILVFTSFRSNTLQLTTLIKLIQDNEQKLSKALFHDLGKHPAEAYRDLYCNNVQSHLFSSLQKENCSLNHLVLF